MADLWRKFKITGCLQRVEIIGSNKKRKRKIKKITEIRNEFQLEKK